MKPKVAINGFGRIGRLVFRAGYKSNKFEIIAINDISDAKTLAHLLKYDSVHRKFDGKVELQSSGFVVDGKEYRVLSEKDPAKLPWKELGIDYVIEASGKFTERSQCEIHLKSGAKRVVVTAPAKGEPKVPTIVMGINEDKYDPKKDAIVSNASCTTNCFAPMVKVLHENFTIKKGYLTTIHAYTNDQRILDLVHKDLRRARAAGMSMIPTSTGAARVIGEIFPELKGKLDGVAIRVPTANVSICDFVCCVEKETTKEEVNNAFKQASQGPLGKYLQYCDEPLVSVDFIGNPHSSVFDPELTMVNGHFIKTFAWYDNEWAYSLRIVDLLEYIIGRE